MKVGRVNIDFDGVLPSRDSFGVIIGGIWKDGRTWFAALGILGFMGSVSLWLSPQESTPKKGARR